MQKSGNIWYQTTPVDALYLGSWIDGEILFKRSKHYLIVWSASTVAEYARNLDLAKVATDTFAGLVKTLYNGFSFINDVYSLSSVTSAGLNYETYDNLKTLKELIGFNLNNPKKFDLSINTTKAATAPQCYAFLLIVKPGEKKGDVWDIVRPKGTYEQGSFPAGRITTLEFRHGGFMSLGSKLENVSIVGKY